MFKPGSQHRTGVPGQTYQPSDASQQPQVYVPGFQKPNAANSSSNSQNPNIQSATTYSINSTSYAASSGPTQTPNSYSPSSSPYPNPVGTETVPGFSQALDLPHSASTFTTSTSPAAPVAAASQGHSYTPSAPYNPASSTFSSGKATGDYSSSSYLTATEPPTGSSYAPSVANSAVYNGGPTNGLISEGNPTRCHKVDYEIKGHELQLVEIELDRNETVIAEAGALMFLDEGIDFKTKFGDGSSPKPGFFNQLLSAGGRILTGESLFLTHFTNKGQSNKARVAFAAPFPGNIVPINMQSTGGRLICQKDAFLCAAFGTKLALHFNKRLGSGFFGGEGFILQRLEGDGMAFIHAGGTVIRRELRNERLRLDTGCLVAFTDGIQFDVQLVPGLKSIIFGGEGLFLATLQGTGTVWMQSLPLSRFADKIVRSAPSIGGRRQGETDFVASAVNTLF